MKIRLKTRSGLFPLLVGITSLFFAFYGNSAHAAPQYAIDCTSCHKMPPLDSPTGARDPFTGAVKGNHQTHAGTTAVSCAKCHDSAVLTYTTGHRGKPVELQENINTSPAGGAYSRVFFNQTSVPPNPLGTCSNVNCHFEATTDAWGVPQTSTYTTLGTGGTTCGKCHGAPPSDGNHPATSGPGKKHGDYYTTGTGSCIKCHPDHAAEGKPFAHATSAGNRSLVLQFAAAPDMGLGSYSKAANLNYPNYLPSQTPAANRNGTCSNIYCHSNGAGGAPNVVPTWGGSLDCKGCHNSTVASGTPMTSGKHGAHLNSVVNYGCVACHAKTVSNDTTIADVTKHVSGFVNFSGSRAGRSYNSNTGVCTTVYCHSDGKGNYKDMTVTNWKSSAALDCKGCHGSDAAPAFSSAAGEPNYANGGAGQLRANTHKSHVSGATDCINCHVNTVDSTGKLIGNSHTNGTINVDFNPAKAGTGVTWTKGAKSCANIQCHGTGSSQAQWGSTGCLSCHSVPQGGRAAITGQFGANSHHIQGTVTDDKCYQCHWEANSDGSINNTYHHSSTSGGPVELVVYGAGTRPGAYSLANSVTAVQYTANGARGEIQKINTHCLGCHSDQNNGATPFGDGKTPKQYAWDGTSVAARYAQTGTTTWGKYSTVANAAQKRIAKAYSAHGNAAANARGWNTATGVDGAITNTGGTVNVLCFDCHNSHGSTVAGTTTRYASSTVNGGILKDTTVSGNGYAVAYKPYSAGSSANKNKRSAGASLCLDCHMNATANQTPWGYTSTYGASQQILGYWDSPYMSYSTCGPEQRYSYKKKNNLIKGGHFGASMTMTTTPAGTIGGLCTPCHDPHGVSPSLGASQQYAVPLLKGTWITSPYKEDVAPANNTWLTNYGGEGVQYHIDQNTFGPDIRSTVTGITQSADQSAGLCLGCHPQSSLTTSTSPSNPNPWKSKNRVHEAVKGWKTSDGTVQHNYTCSKCHSAHTSSVLPRLMVTNCLDGQHKGRLGYNPAPVLSGSSSGDVGGGSGRIPGSYGGSGDYNSGPGNGLPAPGDVSVTCHDSAKANNSAAGGTDQGWNVVTPWFDPTPSFASGPTASSGGLRLQMHMDETAWNGTVGEVKDSSVEANNGTAYYATVVAGGISGNAGSFNGSYAYVPFNYASGIPMDNFTMEAWVRPTATHQIDTEATSGTSGTSGKKYLFWPDQMGSSDAGAGVSVGTNGISVYEHGNGYMPAVAVYSGPISSTQWTHIAVVYANKQPSIYVNGTLVHTGLQSPRTHVYASRTIGGGNYGYYAGLVDEVAVYNGALSAADIVLHAQQTCAGLASSGNVSVNWTTNINSTSYVDYGLTTSYDSTAGDDSLVTSHSVNLPNLTNYATYHYRIRSKSAAGVETTSVDTTFSVNTCTSVPSAPATPTGIAATSGNGQATITWTTGIGATSSLIRYGTATGTYATTIDPATSPQTITGLTNGQTIYYQVGAKNTGGITWSPEYTVTPSVSAPTTATSIAATAGNGQTTVTWTTGSGATSSLIRYGTVTGTYSTQLTGVTSPSTITGLTNGATIYYQVGATNGSGTTWSAEYSVTPSALAPTAATTITQTPGNGQATISWTAGTGATSSSIRYGTATGTYSTQLTGVTSPSTITGLTNGATIYYQVGATNGSGTTWSTEYSVTPSASAPTAATGIAAAPGNAQATFTWTVGSGSTSSSIRYGTATGTYTTQIPYVYSGRIITGLTNGTTYYFQVGAVNASGTTWSAEYTVTPVLPPPTAPYGISPTAGNGQITISWFAGTYSTSSLVRYGTVNGGPYGSAIDPAVSPLTISGLTNGQTIYFQVGAKNTAGTTWSSQSYVTPTASAPVAPTSVSAIVGNGQATIIWTAGAGSSSSSIRYGTATGTYSTQLLSALSPRTITGLTNGQTIYYQVGAVSASGTTWSPEYTLLPTTSAPPAATGISAVAGSGQVTVSWTAGTGATSSLIRYGTTTGIYPTTIDPATSPSSITGLADGTAIYYQVGARNGSGTTWSSEFTITTGAPSTPSPVTTDYVSTGSYYYRYYSSDCINNTTVTLAWNPVTAPDGDPVEYNVQLNGVLTGWQTGTSYTFAAAPGGSYSWSVKARDSVHTANISALSSTPMYEWSTSCSSGSCPMLYTWDGTKFVFEVDVFGSGKLGLMSGTSYVKPNPDDFYLLGTQPALGQDGMYELRMVEERSETDYMDNVKLYTVDMPQNRDVYAELASFNAANVAQPSTVLHTVDTNLQHPVSILRVNTGEDVSGLLAASDQNYLVLNDDNNNFTWQTLEIDFGDLSQAPMRKLLIDAISIFPTTSAGFALANTLSPSPNRMQLEVLDGNGNWVVVPSSQVKLSKPWEFRRPYVVDLSNIFLTNVYKIRLSFLFKTYVDAIAFDTTADVPVSINEVPLNSATLGYYGSSARTSTSDLYTFLYGVPSGTDYHPQMPGNYTRYGDVSPLLAGTDDKLAIFSGGDEVRLKFGSATSLPAGTARRFLLYSHGYYKDFKKNAVIPKTVEPLPFNAMTNFPYDTTVENYPMDADHQQYLVQYNTRVFPAFASPLPTPQSSPVPAVGDSASITFQWGAVTASSGYGVQYQVEVSSAPDFVTISYQSSWQTDTSWTQAISLGTWYWRVKARDSVYTSTVSTSTSSSLTVVDTIPSTPTPSQ